MTPRRSEAALTAWMSVALLLCAAAAGVPDAKAQQVAVDDAAQAYRQIRIEVDYTPAEAIAGFEIWYADQAFESTGDAELHSTIRVADTSDLERGPEGVVFDRCWSDGLPIHRDAGGNPVVNPDATNWSCALSGMTPGAGQWIAVVPVGADGAPLVDTESLQPVVGRTDVPDERTPPPDTRPVLYALSLVVLSTVALLLFLRRQDALQGRSKSRLAHIYVAPALIALATLTFYPIFYGIWLAFTNADQSRLGDEAWIGLANFATIFAGPGVWRVTLFTFVWALSNVLAHVMLGLALAVALDRRGLRGRMVYRTILLLPWAIPGYISVLAWNGMLQPDGLVNGMLGTAIDFFDGAGSARTVVVLVNIWLGVPFMMMVFSGALQALPASMYEVAEIDGVSRWDQFCHLTLPNLKGTLVPVSLLGFIWTFNSFNTIYLLTRGNPYSGFGEPGATDTLITHVFAVAFEYGQYGVAAAWSLLIFLVLIGFSWGVPEAHPRHGGGGVSGAARHSKGLAGGVARVSADSASGVARDSSGGAAGKPTLAERWYVPAEIRALAIWVPFATLMNLIVLGGEVLRANGVVQVYMLGAIVMLLLLSVSLTGFLRGFQPEMQPHRRDTCRALAVGAFLFGVFSLQQRELTLFNLWAVSWLLIPTALVAYWMGTGLSGAWCAGDNRRARGRTRAGAQPPPRAEVGSFRPACVPVARGGVGGGAGGLDRRCLHFSRQHSRRRHLRRFLARTFLRGAGRRSLLAVDPQLACRGARHDPGRPAARDTRGIRVQPLPVRRPQGGDVRFHAHPDVSGHHHPGAVLHGHEDARPAQYEHRPDRRLFGYGPAALRLDAQGLFRRRATGAGGGRAA